jgi:hypothetical protein
MIACYLDLSTGHLTRTTQHLLAMNTKTLGWPAMTIADYTYGWFVTVPAFDDPEILAQRCALPDDLQDVLTHAYTEGCQLIRFDADGDQLDDLPYYED